MNKLFAAAGIGATALDLAAGLAACGGASAAPAPHQHTSEPGGYAGASTAPAAPTAQEVAQSVMGGKMSMSVDSLIEKVDVHSVYPTGVVTTDAAGDATVSVSMDLHYYDSSSDPNYGGWMDEGNFTGTATLFADGSSTFTVSR
jgi:hypothetical protein